MQDTINKSNKSSQAVREEEILSFWRAQHIFEQSLEQTQGGEEFVFYDGPPFATGLPHYGHILASTLKDVIPRYQTMRGKYVPRRWGWDCHGLPIENEIEKELGLASRKDIVEYGIAQFNEQARQAVQRYVDEWREIIPRMGRFVDMQNDYRTMDPEYTESIWWSFKELYNNDLIYKNFKSMHICPRCETTLSNFEVTQGYQEIKDLSVTVKFASAHTLLHLPKTKNANVYFLAWTTTPWTLPGNVALAVNKNMTYIVSYLLDTNEYVVVAKECAERVLHNVETKVVQEIHGSDLVGVEYKPPFDDYVDADIDGIQNAWRVYSADFVTAEEGTGIVHIAPGYGTDDMELGREYGLPMIQHVTMNGEIKSEVNDLAGLQAKPKEDPTATDVEVIKYLAHNNILFAKEKITHSYPHCWRCDTPLLNFAADSWFVKVTAFKGRMVEQNTDIHWVPEDVGRARFGNWLADARDWAISRSRFWGAPLPVWHNEDDSVFEICGSRDELVNKAPDKIAKVYFMRHGESEKNVAQVYDSSRDTYALTKTGEDQAKQGASRLTEENIVAIYTSPVRRARETADIIAKKLGCKVIEADELWEVDNGEWEGKEEQGEEIKKSSDAYHALSSDEQYHAPRGKTGESWHDVEKRIADYMRTVIQKHKDGAVLFVGHQGTKAFAFRLFKGWGVKETLEHRLWDPSITAHADPTPLYIDRTRETEFDFHRPYIDEIVYTNKDGHTMRRVEDVFDCWYESGSMPFATGHYPFETNERDPKNHVGFPADFIAEGLDQTRGWFYSLMNLSTGLFNEAPYKNVIVNGTILAEDGSKMSKRKKNYPDPMDVVARYGADALRYYMLSSPVVRGENLNFEEKGVDEISKKVIGRLSNVVSFYEQYAPEEHAVSDVFSVSQKSHVLDIWITGRLNELIAVTTKYLDEYELDRASRPIGVFVDDLSVWYLRRSRDRIKSDTDDSMQALTTLRFVLHELAKVIAPFMPFIAEDIYQRVGGARKSVHLEQWPQADDIDTDVLTKMANVRELITQALDKRSDAGIKVRQPLNTLYTVYAIDDEYKEIVKDEVNVKHIEHIDNQEEKVSLDTGLTKELQDEGVIREFIRAIQNVRKQQKLQPGQNAMLTVATDITGKTLLEKWKNDVMNTTAVSDIVYDDTVSGEKVEAHDVSFVFSVSPLDIK